MEVTCCVCLLVRGPGAIAAWATMACAGLVPVVLCSAWWQAGSVWCCVVRSTGVCAHAWGLQTWRGDGVQLGKDQWSERPWVLSVGRECRRDGHVLGVAQGVVRC